MSEQEPSKQTTTKHVTVNNSIADSEGCTVIGCAVAMLMLAAGVVFLLATYTGPTCEEQCGNATAIAIRVPGFYCRCDD